MCKDLHGFNLTLSSSSAAAAASAAASLSAGGVGGFALIEERKSEQMSMFRPDYTHTLILKFPTSWKMLHWMMYS